MKTRLFAGAFVVGLKVSLSFLLSPIFCFLAAVVIVPAGVLWRCVRRAHEEDQLALVQSDFDLPSRQ